MINRLYSVIVNGHDVADDWYFKKHAAVQLDDKARRLCEAMMDGVPEDRVAMLACIICDWSRYTPFAEELAARDPENTYCPTPARRGRPARPLIKPVESLRSLYVYLDKDITDKLVCPTWMDIMAACGLQLLRSVDNGV